MNERAPDHPMRFTQGEHDDAMHAFVQTGVALMGQLGAMKLGGRVQLLTLAYIQAMALAALLGKRQPETDRAIAALAIETRRIVDAAEVDEDSGEIEIAAAP